MFLDFPEVPSSTLVEGLAPPPLVGDIDLILQTTDPECKLKSLMPKLLALSLNRLSFPLSVSNAPLQSSFCELAFKLKGCVSGVEKMRWNVCVN